MSVINNRIAVYIDYHVSTGIGHLNNSVSGKSSQQRWYLCWVLKDEQDLEIQGMEEQHCRQREQQRQSNQ